MERSAGSNGGSGAGAGSECEGEDQDEPSSTHFEALIETLEHFSMDDNEQKKEPVDELSEFRNQWQRELQATPSPQREPQTRQQLPETNEKEDKVDEESREDQPQTDEERAKQLFLRGVEFERAGKLYEAIQHYKRAMQILPDVETKLYESSKERADTPEEESESEEIVADVDDQLSSDDEATPGEELVTRLRRRIARRGRLCDPQYTSRGAHISWLPHEVILLIMRWVVSSDLDAISLERLGATCRGLYVIAREPDLWRSLCVRTWGKDCGTPRAHDLDSWRRMYISRPRLHLHGLYISKTTYLRHGENSFQDQFYRPWYLIDYYRYLRFFPDGVALMMTTPEEPAACVGLLKHRGARPHLGILAGHYRLVGDKVVIVIKKTSGEKKPAQASNTRFRARRKDLAEQHEQTFHMELEVRSVRSRRNQQLAWQRYAVCARRDQWTSFDLAPNKFPPFAFSRVRHYTADSQAPL